jgi:hypothetical protein
MEAVGFLPPRRQGELCPDAKNLKGKRVLVDLVVGAHGQKVDLVFSGFWIRHELEENAIVVIDGAGPNPGQVASQFVAMQ